MRKVVLFLMILLYFINIGCGIEDVWISDSSLVSGLGSSAYIYHDSVYNLTGLNDWTLISGEWSGSFNGFYWNGTQWISDSTRINGLGDIGNEAHPSIAYNLTGLNDFTLISGNSGGTFNGFYWNGTQWISDSTRINGLGDTGLGSLPEIVYNLTGNNNWNLISGESMDDEYNNGIFYGFYWNGTQWISDSSLISGLGKVGKYNSPKITYNLTGLNDFTLIAGVALGEFYGFYWNGTQWISDSTRINGLGDIGEKSVGESIYNLTGNNNWTLIASADYSYYGFNFILNINPTIPTSFTDLGNNLVDHTPTITWTEGTDADGDTVTTYIYVGTNNTPTEIEGWTTDETYDLGTNITLEDGTIYYYRLRSHDGCDYSDYTTADEFKMNAKPSVSNITISPDPTAVEDDLTALNDTATDADGDPVTLYYRWYKNSVHQSALTTSTVNSTNTSNGELWKVGIIPNDGYENGTEVQSQTVEIGSSNSAPTATGASINISYPIKRYVNFSITGLNASDPNNDQCRIEVGSSTGSFDLGVSGYMNASVANVTIAMPYYDGLEHTLYVRLNDSNLTSQEYIITITSDITLPILNSESRSPSTGTQGASFGITINTTSINSTIKTVTVSVSRPDATTANWSMSNTVNDTWYYSYTSTSDIGTYTINSYTITDASDNVNTTNSALSFTITAAVVTEGGGGGGGGGTTIIQVGDISDLTITPPRLDTYVLYGGLGHDRMLKYRFIANRNVTSCTVEPTEEHNGVATCEIIDGYIVDVYLTINDSKGYSGTLTVRDSDEFVATSDLIVRVIDIGAHIKIVNIPVGEAIASSLNLFFASENGMLIGIRAWSVGATIGFLGLFLFKSDIFE